MKKNITLFLVLSTSIVVLAGAFIYFSYRSCQNLACISIQNQEQYKIKEIYEENSFSFRALYEQGNTLLRLQIRPDTSSSEAQQAIQSQITRIKGLFEDASSPYPGEISNMISCSKEFKPNYTEKEQNGINISYFTGFVNNRLVFGSCSTEQANYYDTFTMFYCERQKKFYQLEIIVPREDYQREPEKYHQIIESIGCKR